MCVKKQRGQSLQFDNLGETLGAARNARNLGTQQFETPLDVARALMLPLCSVRETIVDIQCGHGALLAAAANNSTRNVLGIDIDPTATALPEGAQLPCKPLCGTIIGDLQRIAPLLRDVNFQCDLLVLNPPFSLKWKDGDSTLVTWKLALEFLTARGEGMMICNHATALRLIAPTPEARRIWLWVTLPNFFPGTLANIDVAVLYFAADHKPDTGTKWMELRLPTNHPDAVAVSLTQFVNERKRYLRGSTISGAWQCHGKGLYAWSAVTEEWKRLQEAAKGKREGWNIRLRPDGKLDAWLTPFQSITAKVPAALAEELQNLNGKHPAGLVVQKVSRLALKRAVTGGIWRVQPAVTLTVEKAIRDYNAARAPLMPLGPVQRLGSLDEEDTIVCCGEGVPGFTPGRRYLMVTETFEGRKIETRPRPGEKPEQVEVSGQELAIIITDDVKFKHCFTQFAPTEHEENRPAADFHRTLQDLLACFTIPEVPDVAEINPMLYQSYKARLLQLEAA